MTNIAPQTAGAARRARRWVLLAAAAVMLGAAATSTATACGHGKPPRYGGGTVRGVSHAPWGYRRSAPHRRRVEHPHERAYAAGMRDGWRSGYYAGRYGRAYHPRPRIRHGGRARHQLNAYARGFRAAYERGYRQGRWQRGAHRRRH
jgi:hypothetical protein